VSIHTYATLNFSKLHFVLPFVLAALRLMHIIVLHDTAELGNLLGVSGNCMGDLYLHIN